MKNTHTVTSMTLVARLRLLWAAPLRVLQLEHDLAEAENKIDSLESDLNDKADERDVERRFEDLDIPDADDFAKDDDLSKLQDEVDDKADGNDFERLSNKVDGFVEAIESKADSTDFERLGERVDTLKERVDELQATHTLVVKALGVLVLTPHVRAYLAEHDPKGLEQAERALTEEPLRTAIAVVKGADVPAFTAPPAPPYPAKGE